jgi:hypothetical protein
MRAGMSVMTELQGLWVLTFCMFWFTIPMQQADKEQEAFRDKDRVSFFIKGYKDKDPWRALAAG